MSVVEAGQIVDGRYEILERVGTGGMADVFCAQDRQLGRRVALKLLHQRFADDATFVERFRREASSAAGLSHPNVVGVYDRGEWDGRPYIAMEYLDGRTLKELVVERGPLPVDQAVDLTIQILRAARFAHRRGIIHRDLKPQNVMLDGEGRVKVTDFGIARAGASDMTETGSLLGTAQYLAPEQAQGHAVSPATDLYSIGIVLFELMTGRLPFDGDSAVSVALKHVSEAPPTPSGLNPAIGPELDAIVLRALAKDPAQRFGDADAFITALEGPRAAPAVVGAPVIVEREVIKDAPLDVERRRRWPWVVLALVLLALGVAAVVLLLGGNDRVRVPEVTGRTVRDASARLRAEGFEVRSERRSSSRVARDMVLRQDPRAGTTREEGSVVRLVVSSGPRSVRLPNVVGDGRGAATRELRALGLEVGATRRRSSASIGDNRVIETDPPPGTQLEVGASVTLVVSSGPPRVDVPRVVGLTRGAAREALEAQGLVLGAVTLEEREDVQAGIVLSQGPPAGTSARRGSAVGLVVAREPERVTVPDVDGRSQARARLLLERAGLTVDAVEQDVDDPLDADRVIAQDPPAGDEVERGTQVTITMGRAPAEVPGQDGGPDPGSGEGAQGGAGARAEPSG